MVIWAGIEGDMINRQAGNCNDKARESRSKALIKKLPKNALAL